jgi:hypothetical protein
MGVFLMSNVNNTALKLIKISDELYHWQFDAYDLVHDERFYIYQDLNNDGEEGYYMTPSFKKFITDINRRELFKQALLAQSSTSENYNGFVNMILSAKEATLFKMLFE